MTVQRAISIFLVSLAFGPAASAVTLDEAFQSALLKNESILQTHEKVEQAKEQYEQAKSTVYPNLSFNATHLIQPRPTNPTAREFFPEKQTTTNLTLTQPLFKGFREFAALRQRKDLVGSQQQERLMALLQIYQQVATVYLNVLSYEQDLKNLNEQQALYGQRVKDLRGRSQRGESQATEVLTAQYTAASLDAETRMVEAQLKTSRETFSFMTGLAVDSKLMDEEDTKSANMTLGKLEDYLSRLELRPDIQAAKQKAQALEEGVSIARGGHWPTLDAVGNYYFKRPDGFMSELEWDVQLRLSMPIFEGGLKFSQTREALAKQREGDLELSKLRRQAAADIRALHESLKMRAEQLAALKRSADLAEKNVQVLQRESRRGLSKSLDVQMGLTEYRTVRRTYDQARYLARLDLIRLNSAAALLPASIVKEN